MKLEYLKYDYKLKALTNVIYSKYFNWHLKLWFTTEFSKIKFKLFFQAILKLMQHLRWNYIAIVYDDDDYGREAAKSLKFMSEQHGICVPSFTALPEKRWFTISFYIFQIFINSNHEWRVFFYSHIYECKCHLTPSS